MKKELMYTPQFGYKGIVFCAEGARDVASSYTFSDVVYALLPYTYVGDCDIAIKDKFGLRRISKTDLQDLAARMKITSQPSKADWHRLKVVTQSGNLLD